MQVETNYKVYSLTINSRCMDVVAIHAYLSRSSWAANIPLDIVRRSLANFICMGVFKKTVAFIATKRSKLFNF